MTPAPPIILPSGDVILSAPTTRPVCERQTLIVTTRTGRTTCLDCGGDK